MQDLLSDKDLLQALLRSKFQILNEELSGSVMPKDALAALQGYGDTFGLPPKRFVPKRWCGAVVPSEVPPCGALCCTLAVHLWNKSALCMVPRLGIWAFPPPLFGLSVAA